MADWDSFDVSGNVEDRRGLAPALMGGGGIVALLLALGLNFLGLNVSPSDVERVLETTQVLQGSKADPNSQPEEFRGEDSYEIFTKKVLGSTDTTWSSIFQQSGRTYEKPSLVLFRQATQSGCGAAVSQSGPHYCPADSTIYLDETFFDQLRTQFGANTGEAAQAYVISHEVAHHVQSQLGVFGTSRPTNEESIQIELQADCYAGVWAHSIKDQAGFTETDLEQALSAAAAVGDDRIQRATTGQVDTESWTHGSSEQRVAAFKTGYTTGQPGRCVGF